MKRQNNKKGNLKKKRKYNDVENDNYYEDEQNESENTLTKNNKQTFMEVKSANLLKGKASKTLYLMRHLNLLLKLQRRHI